MGTKNDPGQFDCYANAEPDEPMFVLLGRDRWAPILVRLWAEMRQVTHMEKASDVEKILEANSCADAMEAFWIRRRLKQRRDTARAVVEAAGVHTAAAAPEELQKIVDHLNGDSVTESSKDNKS